MYASFPILQSRPIRAPSRTWTQCQICVPSPIVASGETSAVGWIRVAIALTPTPGCGALARPRTRAARRPHCTTDSRGVPRARGSSRRTSSDPCGTRAGRRPPTGPGSPDRGQSGGRSGRGPRRRRRPRRSGTRAVGRSVPRTRGGWGPRGGPAHLRGLLEETARAPRRPPGRTTSRRRMRLRLKVAVPPLPDLLREVVLTCGQRLPEPIDRAARPVRPSPIDGLAESLFCLEATLDCRSHDLRPIEVPQSVHAPLRVVVDLDAYHLHTHSILLVILKDYLFRTVQESTDWARTGTVPAVAFIHGIPTGAIFPTPPIAQGMGAWRREVGETDPGGGPVTPTAGG